VCLNSSVCLPGGFSVTPAVTGKYVKSFPLTRSLNLYCRHPFHIPLPWVAEPCSPAPPAELTLYPPRSGGGPKAESRGPWAEGRCPSELGCGRRRGGNGWNEPVDVLRGPWADALLREALLHWSPMSVPPPDLGGRGVSSQPHNHPTSSFNGLMFVRAWMWPPARGLWLERAGGCVTRADPDGVASHSTGQWSRRVGLRFDCLGMPDRPPYGTNAGYLVTRLPITDHRLPITDHRLPITDYRLPITDYQSPIIITQ